MLGRAIDAFVPCNIQNVGRLHDFNVNFSDLPESPDKQTFSVYVGRSQGGQSPEVGAYFVRVMPWITNYWTRGSLIRNDAPP
jgi:hypothetical protein